MKFSRWVFSIAGIYGVISVAPLYFMEQAINGQDSTADHTSDVLLRIRRGDAGMATRCSLRLPTSQCGCVQSFLSPCLRS